MPHKLGVIPRIDVTTHQAELRVAGCLTSGGSTALQLLIRRAGSVSGIRSVVVDLTTARHIDHDGLEQLNRFSHSPNHEQSKLQLHTVQVEAPPVLPSCPAHRCFSEPSSRPATQPAVPT